MKPHLFTAFAATSCLLIGSGLKGQQVQREKKDVPNIILIQVDQMRPDHLGAKTPALMKLASQGVLFSHAYTASPVCQPSRNSIITGLYNSQTGICGNQSNPINADLRNSTFMNRLQDAGYYTAMIGKHHYIDRYAVGIDAVKEDAAAVKAYGFDFIIQCMDVGEHTPNEDNSENIDDYIYYLRSKGLEKKYFSEVQNGIKTGHHPLALEDSEDGYIGTEAVKFVKNYKRKQPFYLNVSFIGPHPPYMVPGEFRTRPEDTKPPVLAAPSAETARRRAVYADMCTHIDNYIAQLVEALKSMGLYENTTIIFVADHGDNLGDYGIWDKRYFYEQSVGVPMLMSGKGITGTSKRFEAVVSKALVSTLDIYPTVLALAGIDMAPAERPGKNLLEQVNKDNPSAFRSAVFSQLGTSCMIRTPGWKMVFDPEQGGTVFLFNLIADPGELINLAGVAGYETITSQLTSELLSHNISLNQYTQAKEQMRLQKVRVRYTD